MSLIFGYDDDRVQRRATSDIPPILELYGYEERVWWTLAIISVTVLG